MKAVGDLEQRWWDEIRMESPNPLRAGADLGEAVGPRDTSNPALLRIAGRSWSLGQENRMKCVRKWVDWGGQREHGSGNSKLGVGPQHR